jgi:hypothetical protein
VCYTLVRLFPMLGEGDCQCIAVRIVGSHNIGAIVSILAVHPFRSIPIVAHAFEPGIRVSYGHDWHEPFLVDFGSLCRRMFEPKLGRRVLPPLFLKVIV